MPYFTRPSQRGVRRRARLLCAVSAFSGIAFLPQAAVAQSPTSDGRAANDEQPGWRDEIIVVGQGERQSPSIYTVPVVTAATRLPLTLRETPQAVTVMTRENLDDQQLNSVQNALEATAGLSSRTLDSERVTFFARGFAIDSFQYDGIPTAFVSGASFLDTAFFERFEVVRGATGLLTGTGNPSASINLVRKRPGRQFAASATLSAGSWDNFRGMADISAPLSRDGHVRARLVGILQDREGHVDRYRQAKRSVYGIVEADLGPRTLISIGYDHQAIRPEGTTWSGMPLWFSDGTPTRWSRSKSMTADWSRWDNTLDSAFLTLEHQFAGQWVARAAVMHQRSSSDARLFSGLGYPDRVTGEGLQPFALASYTRSRQNSIDATLSGPVSLLGRKHDLVFGVMANRRVANEFSSGFVLPSTPFESIFDWTGAYPEPDFDARPFSRTRTVTRQGAFYGAAKLDIVDRLKVIVGTRLTFYDLEQQTALTSFEFSKSGRITPYAGAVLDLDSHHSAYVSYTEIFNPQTNRDRDERMLAPTNGRNVEFGVKGSYFGGRASASIAVFKSWLDNVGQIDPGQLLPDGTQAYFAANGTTSRGVEIDLQGEILPGWNTYAGFAHFVAENADGGRLNAELPRTSGRIFSTYRFAGPLRAVTVGGGVNWRSASFESAASPMGPVRTRQVPYALVSLMARYDLSARTDLSLKVNNLTDRRYTVVNGFFNQVLFGEPRNAMLALTVRY